MSVSFFPSFEHPLDIEVNMCYSSFGEVRSIVASLIDKDYGELIKEVNDLELYKSVAETYHRRYAEVRERLRKTLGEGFFMFFEQSDCDGSMTRKDCAEFIKALEGKNLDDIEDEYRRGQIKDIVKMMQMVVDSKHEDDVFQWY